MNMNGKNAVKTVFTAALFLAAGLPAAVSAEVTIAVQLYGADMPRHSAARSEMFERLSAAAGETGGAFGEAQLSGLYSGAAKKAAVEPVYAPEPAAPATLKRAALPEPEELGISEPETKKEAPEAKKEDEAPKVDPMAEYEAEYAREAAAAAKAEAAKDGGKSQSLLNTLFGGSIGMLLVILLLCLL